MDVRLSLPPAKRPWRYVRGGKGPYILEMNTYRYRGHSMSDPAKYRTKEEVDKMKSQHDPIDHLRATLVDGGMATEDDLAKLDTDIRQRVVEAAEFAQKSPEPDIAELWTDILIEA